MALSIKAMWNYKCPRCRVGDLFRSPLQISKPLDMYKQCSHCQQKYEPEPGYYYGAMFVSYIFLSWYILLPTLALVFYFGWSVEQAMVFAIALTVISYLIIVRASRSLWIHIMIPYNQSYAQNQPD